MINAPDFYPTPAKLIAKMIAGINLKEISTVLEPSAGKGDIVDYLIERTKPTSYRGNQPSHLDIDTIEIDQNLRHILKGKGYRVVHDDFLTFQTFKHYDLVIMNPPFSDGDKHLLKALEIQKHGGTVVCLLNAETIRNPFTNARKDLAQKLEEYNAKIEYVGAPFSDAERKTYVDVVLIKASIPVAERRSLILNGLRRQESFSQQADQSGAITDADFLKAIVERYNFEMRAGLNLLNEYFAMKPYILESIDEERSNHPVIKLKVGEADREPEFWNSYIQSIRYKYWKALFESDTFNRVFTTKLRHEYHGKISDLKNYDFSLFNIYGLKADLIRTMSKSIEDTIIELFDDLSRKYHWHEESNVNIHYYNGWKANSAWKINPRVIIRLSAWHSWSGRYEPTWYETKDKLMDIEKALNYLDGGRTDHLDLAVVLKRAEEQGETKKIQLKYFTVTFYKKGTCHIEFTNLDLLKKFNLFGSQRKGWLPPSYGKAAYEDMTNEEKAVVDEFEGAAEYRKVMADRDYYIADSVGLPALGYQQEMAVGE